MGAEKAVSSFPKSENPKNTVPHIRNSLRNTKKYKETRLSSR
jgi:hypothetical protein